MFRNHRRLVNNRSIDNDLEKQRKLDEIKIRFRKNKTVSDDLYDYNTLFKNEYSIKGDEYDSIHTNTKKKDDNYIISSNFVKDNVNNFAFYSDYNLCFNAKKLEDEICCLKKENSELKNELYNNNNNDNDNEQQNDEFKCLLLKENKKLKDDNKIIMNAIHLLVDTLNQKLNMNINVDQLLSNNSSNIFSNIDNLGHNQVQSGDITNKNELETKSNININDNNDNNDNNINDNNNNNYSNILNNNNKLHKYSIDNFSCYSNMNTNCNSKMQHSKQYNSNEKKRISKYFKTDNLEESKRSISKDWLIEDEYNELKKIKKEIKEFNRKSISPKTLLVKKNYNYSPYMNRTYQNFSSNKLKNINNCNNENLYTITDKKFYDYYSNNISPRCKPCFACLFGNNNYTKGYSPLLCSPNKNNYLNKED